MPVEIETFVLGPLQTNAYLVRQDRDCWVVDPSLGTSRLLEHVQAEGLTPRRIVLTHGHGDHIGGVDEIREAFPDAKLVCPEGDAGMLGDPMVNLSGLFGFPVSIAEADELIRPGETLSLGTTTWDVLDTAGHTAGGVSYYCAEAGAALVGDALFAGSIGRTDMSGGDMMQLLSNIRDHLLTLPDETRVYSGHGPVTTIGREKCGNPYLRMG